MTELKKNNNTGNITPDFPVDTDKVKRSAQKTAKKVITTILTYLPAAIIFGLIALYYIQLSHMGNV